jgi:hypothetical protein
VTRTGARLIVWRGLEEWLAESAEVELGDDRLRARGTQLGAEPVPYRLDYELTTGPGWVTERLALRVVVPDGERRLDLRHDGEGSWTADGRPLTTVQGARDCDLAFSPLTNAMPVLREGIRHGRGPVDFTMAWVDVPSLTVTPNRQRYEPVDARTVRFVSLEDDFTAALELDEDGLVLRYPRLARRVDPGSLASG